jgi:hypothetical protein
MMTSRWLSERLRATRSLGFAGWEDSLGTT